jgi:hypothetical protein
MSRDTLPLSLLDVERDWLVADYWRLTRQHRMRRRAQRRWALISLAGLVWTGVLTALPLLAALH